MATETAKRDPNYVTSFMGVDLSTGQFATNVAVDETTHRMMVSAIITGNTTAGTPTVSQVASSASSVTLLAANAARKMATFFNDSTQVLYLKLGATASTGSYTVKMAAGSYYELPAPIYQGIIDGIWASANGVCAITEEV